MSRSYFVCFLWWCPVTRVRSLSEFWFWDKLSRSCSHLYSHIYLSIEDLDEKTIVNLTDHLENYIMERLYNAVFCPITSEDEADDLRLQKRFVYGILQKILRPIHWPRSHATQNLFMNQPCQHRLSQATTPSMNSGHHWQCMAREHPFEGNYGASTNTQSETLWKRTVENAKRRTRGLCLSPRALANWF